MPSNSSKLHSLGSSAVQSDCISVGVPFYQSVLNAMTAEGGNGLLLGGVSSGKSALLKNLYDFNHRYGYDCCILLREVPDDQVPGFREHPWMVSFDTHTEGRVDVEFDQLISERALGTGILEIPSSILTAHNQNVGRYLFTSIEAARRAKMGSGVRLLIDDAPRIFGVQWLNALYEQEPGEVSVLAAQTFCNDKFVSNSSSLLLVQGALPGLTPSSIDDLARASEHYAEGEARLFVKKDGQFQLRSEGAVCLSRDSA